LTTALALDVSKRFCKEAEMMKEDLKGLDRDLFTRVEEAKVDESDGE
jgi:hypothetical protein